MKKTIICDIPMKKNIDRVVYTSDDKSVAVSDREVRFPICSYLEKNVKPEDELKIILIVSKDELGYQIENTAWFISELHEVNEKLGVDIAIEMVETDFSQEKSVHEQLMGDIVDKIDNDSYIISDITYGAKDLPIIIFSALQFAEKFLNCEIGAIIYGQASFADGHATNTKIFDVSPLYSLSSVTNMINCDDPDKARKTLKALLSF